MGRRRLISDSFQVVKKGKTGNKKVQEVQSPPLDKVIVQAECLPQDTAQPEELELLKQFDLSWKYGPCTGITRLQRWERADLLGLGPPAAVQELLLKYSRDPVVTHSLWHEYSL